MQNYIPYYNPQAYTPMAYQQPNYIDRYAQQYPQMVPQNVQPQQAPAPSRNFTGRFVNSVEEIAASEVAMDGTMTLFPKSDLSEIYAKAWKSDGTIQTVVYAPIIQEKAHDEPKPDPIMDMIEKRFDDISIQLEQLQKMCSTKVAPRKKEVTADE